MSAYQSNRPAIPANIRREINVEAGYKCSVTNCPEHTYLEIHHINQDREDNRKENLILLCDKHHKMAHDRTIDVKSLRSFKELLRIRSNNSHFVRGQEGDRVCEFLESVKRLLSYNDSGEVVWVDSEAGYWFPQEIYFHLIGFFDCIDFYNQRLRSYDQSVRDTQDRIVSLLQQLLNIREEGRYIYNGGCYAKFLPNFHPGTSEYDQEIDAQKKAVLDILRKVQALVFELWQYVENRSV